MEYTWKCYGNYCDLRLSPYRSSGPAPYSINCSLLLFYSIPPSYMPQSQEELQAMLSSLLAADELESEEATLERV